MSDSAAVVGHSVVSLSAGIGQQDREDIFDCLLRVDRLAGQVSREHHFSYWTYRYAKGLEQRGCVKTSAIIDSPRVITSVSALQNSTFEVIRSAGSAALANLAVESIEAIKLRRLAEHFFESGNVQGDVARFQVVPCLADGNGELFLIVCSIQVAANVEVRDFDFWTETSRDMVLRISGGAYRLDRDIYARHREKIKQELRAAGEQSIESFSL